MAPTSANSAVFQSSGRSACSCVAAPSEPRHRRPCPVVTVRCAVNQGAVLIDARSRWATWLRMVVQPTLCPSLGAGGHLAAHTGGAPAMRMVGRTPDLG
jgi:hypothetical protein